MSFRVGDRVLVVGKADGCPTGRTGTIQAIPVVEVLVDGIETGGTAFGLFSHTVELIPPTDSEIRQSLIEKEFRDGEVYLSRPIMEEWDFTIEVYHQAFKVLITVQPMYTKRHVSHAKIRLSRSTWTYDTGVCEVMSQEPLSLESLREYMAVNVMGGVYKHDQSGGRYDIPYDGGTSCIWRDDWKPDESLDQLAMCVKAWTDGYDVRWSMLAEELKKLKITAGGLMRICLTNPELTLRALYSCVEASKS